MAKPRSSSRPGEGELILREGDRSDYSRWNSHLNAARRCVRIAASAIRDEFGIRDVLRYRGLYDVQLSADLRAHHEIVTFLSKEYPEYGIVSEEGMQGWQDHAYTWVVDPLDGTNNFGYGIAHCAVAISLFSWESIALAVVFDPLLEREYFATEDVSFVAPMIPETGLSHASVSLVTDYSDKGREYGMRTEERLGKSCKRVFNLWAPALDLALVARGEIDAMVCHRASFLDVCAGMFLISSGGGVLIDFDGKQLEPKRTLYHSPVSFIASRNRTLAKRLLEIIAPPDSG